MSSSKREITIVKTPFNRYIDKQNAESNIYNRKSALNRINKAIYDNGLYENGEFILNIIQLTQSILFDPFDIPKSTISEEQFQNNVNTIISYISSRDLFSKTNLLLAPGYQKIKQEIKLIKSGAQGVRGIAVCPRCKKDNIVIFSKQKASGDEGETLFHTCTDCNNKWTG